MQATLLNDSGVIRILEANVRYLDLDDVEKYVTIDIDEPEVADLLTSWRYKLKYPDLSDNPDYYKHPTLAVHIKYRRRDGSPVKRAPEVHYIELDPTGAVDVDNNLYEDTITDLADANRRPKIKFCDLEIRRWEYEPNKYAAYVNYMALVCEPNFFARRYQKR